MKNRLIFAMSSNKKSFPKGTKIFFFIVKVLVRTGSPAEGRPVRFFKALPNIGKSTRLAGAS